MVNDWYSDGKDRLMKEISSDLGHPQNVIANVYSWLINTGFIDHDIEKEAIYARYYD